MFAAFFFALSETDFIMLLQVGSEEEETASIWEAETQAPLGPLDVDTKQEDDGEGGLLGKGHLWSLI